MNSLPSSVLSDQSAANSVTERCDLTTGTEWCDLWHYRTLFSLLKLWAHYQSAVNSLPYPILTTERCDLTTRALWSHYLLPERCDLTTIPYYRYPGAVILLPGPILTARALWSHYGLLFLLPQRCDLTTGSYSHYPSAVISSRQIHRFSTLPHLGPPPKQGGG